MYMYIFSYSHNFRQNSCGFNFVIKLNFFLTFFKITLLGWFFQKMVSNFTALVVYFWDQISGLIFFLFRIFFKGISFVMIFSKNGLQLHRPSGVFLRPNFRVDFFLFRIFFKGISFVKLKVSSIFWWTFFWSD